ncbi:hypothetical protein A7Q09_02735 [Methylacidiphilum sp. Yel]|uniref:helix-turn-helix domain-containing protein n=1 Tax=Methylacidiphilum sp. Yel TaxID=1847730 RepID=UPI001069496D|nr:helix-turn-helix domain-containing protein [Methylacidiphilum sp. Yel]TFE65505.1 hypothetical protein A7Q09_02735 [Methylacidiphilum sp. Yel]
MPKPGPVPWRFFTVSEAAQILSVHPATVRRWIVSGQIQFRRLGKLVRIPEEELARIAQEGLGKRRKRTASKNKALCGHSHIGLNDMNPTESVSIAFRRKQD